MTGRARPIVCTVVCTLACGSVLGLGGLAVAAPPSPPRLSDAQRNPGGYTWATVAINAEPNGAVTAIEDSARGLLVAHSPTAAIERVDAGGVLTREVLLNYGVTAIDGDLASVGDEAVDGAADVYQSDGVTWNRVWDGDERQALVAQSGTSVYVLSGSPGADGVVHARTRKGWQSGVAALPGALPSATAAHRRAVWVGAGPSAGSGPALLFSGQRTRFSAAALSDPGPGPAANERQEVTALLSGPGFLVIALGTFDAATDLPLRGQILLRSDGRKGGTVQVGSFQNEAPLSLAWVDGSLSVGTSAGRLLHQAGGQWTAEPGLPANLAVTALNTNSAGALTVGVQTAGGALVLQRSPKVAAPPAAPANLQAAAASATQVDLTWTDASNDETAFSVERSTAGAANYVEVASLPANSTTYSDTGLLANTAYDYRVSAVNGNVRSTPSNVATATTLVAATVLTYATEVKPFLAGDNLLAIGCAGCHQGRKFSLSPNLADDAADYMAVLQQVDLVVPAQSELLLRALKTQGHAHPVKLLDTTSPQYDKVLKWIQAGAKFK